MWMRCRIRDTCSCSQTCLPRCCRFQVGLSVGLVAAILATVGIAVVYIPSLVSTVLKFRSGVFETLKGGKAFQQLRENPYRATSILGCALWGAIFTAVLCAFFVGGVTFLAVWSVSPFFVFLGKSANTNINSVVVSLHVGNASLG